MSCIAAYHIDFMESKRPAACKFAHSHGNGIPGYLRAIHNSLLLLPVLAKVSKTPWGRCLNVCMVSCGPGRATYVMSMA